MIRHPLALPLWDSHLRSVLAILMVLLPEVATAQMEPAASPYTQAQAERGAAVYAASCATCHGDNLRGGNAPSLAGSDFLSEWARPDRSADDLFYIIRNGMPPAKSATLSDPERLDVLSYVLQQNGLPAGSAPLTSQAGELRRVVFRDPAAEATPPTPDFIAGKDGMEPTATGPTQEELNAARSNGRDWLFATHDYSGQRYVPLARIDRTNVGRLRVACAYQVGDRANFQTSPIVYRGVMYLTTPSLTVAIDAATCRPRWKHSWKVSSRLVWQNRGVAIKDGRVVRVTGDGYLVALDAANGHLLWARRIGTEHKGELFTMAPMIYDDLILVGPAVSEYAVQGWVGAFRLTDGEPVWRFNTVAQPGEPGSETWNLEAGFPVGGGGVWTPFTLDLKRGLLHVAATNPAPDFPAARRGGANLYTNSMVALEVRTGRLAWYDQMVPADDHDWDLTHAGPLFNARVAGTTRDLIATVGKEGVLRVLDRTSHERLFEVPITTRTNVEAPVTVAGTHACPGIYGGVEWSGPAYNPTLNLLFTPAVDWCGTFAQADSVRFLAGAVYLGGTYQGDSTSQGWITAVDGSSGRVRWRYRSAKPMVAAVTATAGGLVFTGELTGDLLALDASTGKVLYRFNTGGPIGGGVVSYEVAGRQYVAVMSGQPSPFWVNEHPGAATAFVFALP